MDIDWPLLERYLADGCSGEERERFERWLAEAPVHRQLVHELRDVAAQSRQVVAPEHEDRLLAALKQRLDIPAAPAEVSVLAVITSAHPRRRMPVLRVAAVAALLIGGIAGTYWLTTSAWRPDAAIGEVARRSVSTPRGQRAALHLPDGSRVTLGAASTLEYTETFNRVREVWLQGEAYFEVEHDERRPFIVRAGTLVATDLGTQFVVRAYPEDRGGRVIVREGKVHFRAANAAADDAGVVLEPGQLGRFSANGAPVVERVALEPHFAWMEGRLIFEGTPLTEALLELERWFDVEFMVADPTIKTRDLYGVFSNQSLSSVLSELGPALQLDYERRGRVVILRSLETAR